MATWSSRRAVTGTPALPEKGHDGDRGYLAERASPNFPENHGWDTGCLGDGPRWAHWVAWRWTVTRTPFSHPEEGLWWGPRSSWRRTTVGTNGIQEKAVKGMPSIPEKNRDQAPLGPLSVAATRTWPSQRKTPPAPAVPPRHPRCRHPPPLTRGAVIQPGAHHRPRRRRGHPDLSLCPASGCAPCGGVSRGTARRWVLRQLCGQRGSRRALFKAA